MIDDAPRIQLAEPLRRPLAEQVAALSGVPTGFLVDALGGSGALDYRIKPVVPEQSTFCGPAITCNAGPADNLAVIAALDSLKAGDVVIAATAGHLGCAVTGDLLLGMARNCGAVGFVTDGCVRDIPGIRQVGLPCFAVGVTPNSVHRSGPGTVGFPVTLGGAAVASGDIVIGDVDGVVVVPRERAEEVLAKIDAVKAQEMGLLAKVQAGLDAPPFGTELLASDRVRFVD